MYNIWDFLNFTISASIVGLFLLLIKALFHDKLTAKWHYAIWIVLLARLIVPLQNTFITSPLSLLGSVRLNEWMALLQMKAENTLQSVFSVPYGTVNHVEGALFQWQNYSLTDWLFVIYIAGVILLSLYFITVYISLRIRIGRGLPADTALSALVRDTAARYNVKSCSNIRICGGFDTPFVCGIIRPVLVIPAHMQAHVTETMILHELLHLQYKDIWMNFVIHAVRILNWCNPVMWFVLNRIQNDSEAFCDQRVLERIEIEEHKAYGYQLLDLARSKYPTVIGTTTMANGKRNIKRRLKRMVDFSHVPKGHGAAAFCITLLLTLSCVANASMPEPDFDTSNVTDARSMEKMLVNAQLYRTRTPEEALNIFCKALEEGNMGYMALVIPPDEWEEYERWVWEIGKTGDDAYTALLGEQIFEESGRPILDDDNTYLYNFRDFSKTHPYFFFEDGEIYRPIKRAEIDSCIIQNLYPIDEETWRCQAIWDWHYDNENLESVYFDLTVEKTNDWNIRILDVQQVKTAAELNGVSDTLQSFALDWYRWPMLAVQSYEDENYDMTLQQFSSGHFQNLMWAYNWNPFGTSEAVNTFQRELDGNNHSALLHLAFKQPVNIDTQMEVYLLPSSNDYEEAVAGAEKNAERMAENNGFEREEYSSSSSDGWHYSTFPASAGNIPNAVHIGGGGSGYWMPEELNEPYRVLILENGELTANIVLEQEAILYE